MNKIKLAAVSSVVVVLMTIPDNLAATSAEPTFENHYGEKTNISNIMLEDTLSRQAMDHLGHGLIMLGLVSLIALTKRSQ